MADRPQDHASQQLAHFLFTPILILRGIGKNSHAGRLEYVLNVHFPHEVGRQPESDKGEVAFTIAFEMVQVQICQSLPAWVLLSRFSLIPVAIRVGMLSPVRSC
jgi:hypothetical protein